MTTSSNMPWVAAAERLDLHYKLFYFAHGRAPAVIYAHGALLCAFIHNPNLNPTTMLQGEPLTFMGVPLQASTMRDFTVVYSPLP